MKKIETPEDNICTARNLLKWNSKNLIRSAKLNKLDLNLFFASEFAVMANGKNIDANHDNYFEFLNTFRATIKSIAYQLQPLIVDINHVVLPLVANIIRINGEQEKYDAILILKFNDAGKIILWKEVYVKINI